MNPPMIYLVVHDGGEYDPSHIFGAFSTREAAEKRMSDLGTDRRSPFKWDTEIIEVPLNEATDKWLAYA